MSTRGFLFMRNYFRVSHSVLEQKCFINLSVHARLLYVYLCKYRNRYGNKKFWHSTKNLSIEINMDKRAITKARKELISIKAIEITRGYYNRGMRAPDWYQVNGVS